MFSSCRWLTKFIYTFIGGRTTYCAALFPTQIQCLRLRIHGSEDVIIDVGKMANLHGDEDASTALTWNQCSKNLLAALEKLSVAQDPENPQNTHASEYALHVQFFSKNKWFEDLFHVWYPLERELRLEVLDNTVFDERIWTRELLTTVTMYETIQTYAQGRHTASLARSTTAGCKRRAEGGWKPSVS
ncbi:hypothetical protein B0H14DRAFT_2556285 [Mycena olivaceomarginata]|nr:hypothetical protein B0H14DRAFT_2556285 [Mycena olivaceomarginata]